MGWAVEIGWQIVLDKGDRRSHTFKQKRLAARNCPSVIAHLKSSVSETIGQQPRRRALAAELQRPSNESRFAESDHYGAPLSRIARAERDR
jgi:hypothetical protein